MSAPGRRPAAKLEPTVLLTALAGATEHIGLIATASTSYNEPYNLARRFASLDHVSGGRAGWNIVTTAGADAARNFGLDDTPLHRDRYRRAGEFVEVSTKLWDSWADDAVIADKERGVHAVAERVRRIDHTGEFFRVDGPLNVQRPPQGYPLLVQAGSSEDGKDFAARYAEAVFTAQQTLEEGIAFYKDVKQRAEAIGRNPGGIKILPGIVPVIGADPAARRRARTPHLRRNGRTGRRHHRALVRQWRGGRLQHHARCSPLRPRGLRGPGGADPPGTGPVPYRVHGKHAPRSLRAAAPRQPALRDRRPERGAHRHRPGGGPVTDRPPGAATQQSLSGWARQLGGPLPAPPHRPVARHRRRPVRSELHPAPTVRPAMPRCAVRLP
ncbi:NtaA/DmoA family FMN-dependent monooxygenase [Streptomyces sp. NPDC056352]|uniref:NtaA/DmoA family FMN-dependent monooxygenase n=1 Tax=Streptomyces sp. NPDC056352 TaxID=3345791 RepID=UPI0035DF989A